MAIRKASHHKSYSLGKETGSWGCHQPQYSQPRLSFDSLCSSSSSPAARIIFPRRLLNSAALSEHTSVGTFLPPDHCNRVILMTKELEHLVKASIIVFGWNWVGLHPLCEVLQDDKHAIAFACFIIKHGAAFSLFYIDFMIHGSEITKCFGIFSGVPLLIQRGSKTWPFAF